MSKILFRDLLNDISGQQWNMTNNSKYKEDKT